jgi:GNAT superfamily N-acetyltransferase
MAATGVPGPVRRATAADIDTMVDTLTTAFFDDPLWGPAFPDAELRAAQASALWRLLVTSSLRYPWTLVTPNVESVAVWIPPGGAELSADEQAGYQTFLIDLAGPAVAAGIVAISDQLEAARPAEPHFYLSLLATHDRHRGAGLGMSLLRESLARIDALAADAYLESCNPANHNRYRSVGFTDHGQIVTASAHIVTTMWRPHR